MLLHPWHQIFVLKNCTCNFIAMHFFLVNRCIRLYKWTLSNIDGLFKKSLLVNCLIYLKELVFLLYSWMHVLLCFAQNTCNAHINKYEAFCISLCSYKQNCVNLRSSWIGSDENECICWVDVKLIDLFASFQTIKTPHLWWWYELDCVLNIIIIPQQLIKCKLCSLGITNSL